MQLSIKSDIQLSYQKFKYQDQFSQKKRHLLLLAQLIYQASQQDLRLYQKDFQMLEQFQIIQNTQLNFIQKQLSIRIKKEEIRWRKQVYPTRVIILSTHNHKMIIIIFYLIKSLLHPQCQMKKKQQVAQLNSLTQIQHTILTMRCLFIQIQVTITINKIYTRQFKQEISLFNQVSHMKIKKTQNIYSQLIQKLREHQSSKQNSLFILLVLMLIFGIYQIIKDLILIMLVMLTNLLKSFIRIRLQLFYAMIINQQTVLPIMQQSKQERKTFIILQNSIKSNTISLAKKICMTANGQLHKIQMTLIYMKRKQKILTQLKKDFQEISQIL
ncbi:transmembrane protein, putative (macronuclear) [Tetrahymena thermophila SB210]|uniref:Transmembrane protein, putative n=1 Tax=Tetrahymena thermophila (strain SB210) TaxID=312017 RepID=W7XJ24_TETTS|nr:transmembrane protein, putative [Tetrahymena thermophila SB210]EWS75146.1 transmembrane protein, putative [Tetrahymena thermophila SB210]|eukprot:XP_012652302.1 transmembrane protein, putative [Tetrahymena thermophila SB210]